MLGLGILRGHRLALATEDQFTPLYIGKSMPLWGLEVIGPLRVGAELTSHLESDTPPTLALISVNLPGLDEAIDRLLAGRKVPYLVFGAPMSVSALNNTTRMLSPFTAFQIADELARLLAR